MQPTTQAAVSCWSRPAAPFQVAVPARFAKASCKGSGFSRQHVALAAAGGLVTAHVWRRQRCEACRARPSRRWRKSNEHAISVGSRSHIALSATSTAVSPTSQWRDWADSLGIDAAKVHVATFADSFGGELRGMAASADLEVDEPVLTVPAHRALQVTTGGDCPEDGLIDGASWRRLDWWAQLAVLLLAEVRRGQDSPLAPWVASLPAASPESIPLNWCDSDLESLGYPALVKKVQQQRADIARACELALAGCDGQSRGLTFTEAEFSWAVQLVRSRTFSGPYEGRGPQERLAQVGLVGLLLAAGVASGQVSIENGFNGALLAVLSIPLTDFFVGQSAGLKRHVLCPVVDYLNHDSAVMSDIAYEYFGDAFAVRIRGSFSKGEEVRINYGDQRSNDELLQYYGFVEPECPHDVYELDMLEHLDAEAKANGTALQAKLSCTGPDQTSMGALRSLLASDDEKARIDAERTDTRSGPVSSSNEALVWRAIALACEGELQRRQTQGSQGDAESSCASVISGFRAEKERVLRACYAHAQSRCGRQTSDAPLSLTTRQLVYPTFEDALQWRHAWADSALTVQAAEQLRTDGYCVLTGAFDADLASRCLRECAELDARSLTTVTTNPCNKGSRSTWLEFASEEQRSALIHETQLPALTELSVMLAGIPQRANELVVFDGPPLRVHAATMVAVYPERAAEYVVHKDSYAPKDSDPATGGTRRLTILAYLNGWHDGGGGELRLHEAENDKPNKRRFTTVAPLAGSLVLFDSPRVWHAVAPSLRGPRWAMTLWVH